MGVSKKYNQGSFPLENETVVVVVKGVDIYNNNNYNNGGGMEGGQWK